MKNYYKKIEKNNGSKNQYSTLYFSGGSYHVHNFWSLEKETQNRITQTLVKMDLSEQISLNEKGTLSVNSNKRDIGKFLGKSIGLKRRKERINKSLKNQAFVKIYPQKIIFKEVLNKAKKFANFLRVNASSIYNILQRYETFEVAQDELNRSIDALESLEENREYYVREVGPIVSFLPSNQPLYALICFGVLPALMSKKCYVKPPRGMMHFFPELIEIIKLNEFFPNISIHKGERDEFVKTLSKTKYCKEIGEKVSVSDVVIFTGTSDRADILRKVFDKNVLFIMNGMGHNPFVITKSADLDLAIHSVIRAQIYNQGQDCAAPNSILVASAVYQEFMKKLEQEINKISIGSYSNPENRVGPISKIKDLGRIQKILENNREYISPTTDGTIRVREGIVEPTIIERPLETGGNYTETFAPIFFVQRYQQDQDLDMYFNSPQYKENAMYIMLHGESKYINKLVHGTLHSENLIIRNTDLHAPGIEKATKQYGGYGPGASSLSRLGMTMPMPTLPQRDIYKNLVVPSIKHESK